MTADELFSNPQELRLPGFARQEAVVPRMQVYPPPGLSVQQWYANFRERFFAALEAGRPFPVFRSSHGEYEFVLGGRRTNRPKTFKGLARFYMSRVYRIAYFQSTFYSGTPGYGYETYKQWHLGRLRRDLARYYQWLAEHGSLLMYFADRDVMSLADQKRFVRWLESHRVQLTAHNYGHIFFVYALFHGSDAEAIFRGRRLLIVTSDQPARTPPLLERLGELGVVETRFVSISRSHSMMDAVRAPDDFAPDLCIVGAGVGAANVLYQLRDLPCPCIDAGFVLDTLAFPQMRRRRIYCVPDEQWEATFPDNDPPYAKNFAL